jgi:GcrA cell cycle regulator
VSSVVWPDEAVVELRRLIDEGRSGSAIAKALTEKFDTPFSRSAVLGKIFRLGIRQPAVPIAPRGYQPGRMLPPNAALPIGPLPSNCELVTILDLAAHHCRWPVSEVRGTDTVFCGAPRIEGWSYCREHAARAQVAKHPARLNRGAK